MATAVTESVGVILQGDDDYRETKQLMSTLQDVLLKQVDIDKRLVWRESLLLSLLCRFQKNPLLFENTIIPTTRWDFKDVANT